MKKIIIGLIVVLTLVFTCNSVDYSERELDQNEMRFMAYDYAEQAVKTQLKSPSTASFPTYSEKVKGIRNIYFLNEKNNDWEIKSWVDAQNGFGGIVRNNFSIKIHIENGKVRYDSFKMY